MNIEIIATQALALLSPYLAKGAEEISTSVAKDLWVKVKSIFKSKQKEGLIEKLVSSPADLKTQGQIEYVLHEELSANDILFEEFKKLVEELQEKSSNNSDIKQIGDNNFAVGGQISNSTITVHK
jgi:hypothetical protein